MRRLFTYALFAAATFLLVAFGTSLLWSFWTAHGYAWPGNTRIAWTGARQSLRHQLVIQRGQINWIDSYSGSATVTPRWIRQPAAGYIPLIVHSPGEYRNFILWQYDAYIGRPLYASSIDPAGRDVALMERQITIPGWVPLTMLAVIAAFFARAPLRLHRTRRRAREGRCTSCGYDLRTQQSGHGSPNCPECGQTLQAASISAK